MTFKERYNKFKKSVSEFWKENKSLIIGVGGFVAGAVIAYELTKDDSRPVYSAPVHQINITTAPPQPVAEENDSWDENSMRENWDWVCELASNMEMGPDEEYHIYSSEFDVEGVRIGNNIVSHMVEGEEVYPDDADTYEELYEVEDEEEEDDEDEDDEEEESEKVVIDVPKDNEELLNFARQFADFCKSDGVETYTF